MDGPLCPLTGQIQLNLAKPSLAVSEYAQVTDELEDFALKRSASRQLLGVTTGPSPEGNLLKERVSKATRLLERLCKLGLAHHLTIKEVASLPIPLVYGADHFESTGDYTKELDSLIKKTIWGVARTATNWHASAALCIPSLTVTPAGSRHVSVCQSIWLKWQPKRRCGTRSCSSGTALKFHVPRAFGLRLWNCLLSH